MEVLSEAILLALVPSKIRSFNPYFNGSPFGRLLISIEKMHQILVSILILMEVLSEVVGITSIF